MSKRHQLRELRRRLQQTGTAAPSNCHLGAILAGRQPLPAGTVFEWVAGGTGGGAENGRGGGTVQLVLSVVRRLMREPGELVIVDPNRECYPPGLSQAGIDLTRTVVIRPDTASNTASNTTSSIPANAAADMLWALEQTLRSRGVIAAVCRLDRLDAVASRRLQLAVERSGSRALLIRPAACRPLPTWADVRILVTPLPSLTAQVRRLRADVLHRRGQGPGETVEVELCDATGDVRVVSQLADPTCLPAAVGA